MTLEPTQCYNRSMDSKDRGYPITKDIEQKSLLRTYIAGKLESLHEYHEAGKYWTDLNTDIESLIKTDPKEAFKFAVETLNPSQSEITNKAHFREWWQGTALIILSNPQVEPFLIDELTKGDKSAIIPSLESFLSYNPPETIKVKDDLSDYPESFNLVASMVLLDRLKGKNLDTISGLEEKTKSLLQNPHIQHIIDLYHTISDDKEFVEPLFQLIHNSP